VCHTEAVLRAADFTWDGYFWTTKASLADARLGPSVKLYFAPEGRGDDPLAAEEIALAQLALDQLDSAAELAVRAIFERYDEWRAEYGYTEAELRQFMPKLGAVDELYRLITISSVSVHQLTNSGEPYIGFEFDSLWDPEHGVGVLLNGARVVDVGGADTAILLWIARRDLESEK